ALMLENGELDVAEQITDTDLQRFMNQPELGVRVEQFNSAVQYYTILNNLRAPLDDRRVRQAFNYAVDKEGMIQTIFLGFGATLAEAPLLTPIIAGYEPVGHYPYDPERAHALLEEAGYAEGAQGKLF